MTTDAPRSITDPLAETLAAHRPMLNTAVGCIFPVRCGDCDTATPGWAAWDRHLAAVLAPVVAGMVTAAKAAQEAGEVNRDGS